MGSIKELLRVPQLYSALMWAIGGPPARRCHVREYIRPFPGCSILDIGCGPADIVDVLPEDVTYVGVDYEASYIEVAKAKRGHRGQFICKSVDDIAEDIFSKFDIVLATGLLHHLDDGQCEHLMTVAAKALKPGGRLVTLDGCYRQGQNPIAKMILDHDRGQFVREKEAYLKLARRSFPHVRADVREDFLRIPYTLVLMTCSDAVLKDSGWHARAQALLSSSR